VLIISFSILARFTQVASLYFEMSAMIEPALIVCLNGMPDKCDTVYLRQVRPASLSNARLAPPGKRRIVSRTPGYAMKR
jgi:hypothetical protein